MKRWLPLLIVLCLPSMAHAASIATYTPGLTTCGAATSCATNTVPRSAQAGTGQFEVVTLSLYGGASAATSPGCTIQGVSMTQWGTTVTKTKSVLAVFHKAVAAGDAGTAITCSWTNSNTSTVTAWIGSTSDNVAPTWGTTSVTGVCGPNVAACTPGAVTPAQNGDLVFEACNFGGGSPQFDSSPFPAITGSGVDTSGWLGWSGSSGAAAMSQASQHVGGAVYDVACFAGDLEASGAGSVLVGGGPEAFNSGSAASVIPTVLASNVHSSDVHFAAVMASSNVTIAQAVGADVFTSNSSSQPWWTVNFQLDNSGTAATAVTSQVVGSGTLTIPAASVAVGDEMTAWFCGTAAPTLPAGWNSVCTSAITNTVACNFAQRTANSTDVAGTTYTWTNGTLFWGTYSAWRGSSTPTIINQSCATAGNANSFTEPILAKCTNANCTLVTDTVQGGSTTVTGPVGNTALTGNTVNHQHWYRVAPTWTSVTSTLNESGTAKLATWWATGLTASVPQPFTFGSNPSVSDAIIVDVGNLNTTTPTDANGTLVNEGMAVDMDAPVAGTANDDLALNFTAYSGCTPSVITTGTLLPQVVSLASRMGVHYMPIDVAASSLVVPDNCGGPEASATLALEAASAPAQTSSSMRLQQQIEEIFSLAPAPSPPASVGSWFF